MTTETALAVYFSIGIPWAAFAGWMQERTHGKWAFQVAALNFLVWPIGVGSWLVVYAWNPKKDLWRHVGYALWIIAGAAICAFQFYYGCLKFIFFLTHL